MVKPFKQKSSEMKNNSVLNEYDQPVFKSSVTVINQMVERTKKYVEKNFEY